MLRKVGQALFLFSVGAFIPLTALPALHDRGRGLIYDDTLNITWLQDWNYAKTSSYTGADVDGLMTWDTAMTWAQTLVYGGVGGWRLPFTDVLCAPPYDMCLGSDMPHLWFIDLGNVPQQFPVNRGLFKNWVPMNYWTDSAASQNPDAAWYFTVDLGNQNFFWKGVSGPAVAVHAGDVSAIPEPTSTALLLGGVACVGLFVVCMKRWVGLFGAQRCG